jgi:hypothetical protein
MARDDNPELAALAAKLLREKIVPELRGKGTGAMLLLSTFGKGGHTAYASTVDRDSAISALEELVLNMHAERARGPHEPTVAESLALLTRAAVGVLEVGSEDVSEEEGMKRFAVLAELVGYRRKKSGPAS